MCARPTPRSNGMPLQPAADRSGPSRVALTVPHRGCLVDLDGFSHVWVIAHLHESVGWSATVDPFLDDRPRGTFATRSPHRPNAVSLSLCRARLCRRAAGIVVEGLDLLDGTPCTLISSRTCRSSTHRFCRRRLVRRPLRAPSSSARRTTGLRPRSGRTLGSPFSLSREDARSTWCQPPPCRRQ